MGMGLARRYSIVQCSMVRKRLHAGVEGGAAGLRAGERERRECGFEVSVERTTEAAYGTRRDYCTKGRLELLQGVSGAVAF